MNKGWPDGFDFETDPVCQERFKPFIVEALSSLEAYHTLRVHDALYVFHEHARRVGESVKATCLHMGLNHTVAQNMYWAILPHDIGKRMLPPDLWDLEEKPTEAQKTIRRTHTDKGVEIVRAAFPDLEHPFKDLMIDIMLNHHEHMDGTGFHGLTAEQLSLPVRLAAIVEAYDGWRIPRPHFGGRDVSPRAVLTRMMEEKGPAMFDMTLLRSFAEMELARQEG